MKSQRYPTSLTGWSPCGSFATGQLSLQLINPLEMLTRMANAPAVYIPQGSNLMDLTDLCGKDPSSHRIALDISDGKMWMGWLVGLIELIQADQAKEAGRVKLRHAAEVLHGIILQWHHKHQPQISKLFLTFGDGRLMLLVVASSEQYDEKLHDSLIDLDLRVYDEPDVKPYKLATRLVPDMEGAYQTFLRPGCFVDLLAEPPKHAGD